MGGGASTGSGNDAGLAGLRGGGGITATRFPGARCVGSGLNFYPTRLSRTATSRGQLVAVVDERLERLQPLRDMCRRCEWTTECVERGLHGGEMWGVWGGVGEHERKRLLSLERRGASIARRCPSCGGAYTWKEKRDDWTCGHCGHTW